MAFTIQRALPAVAKVASAFLLPTFVPWNTSLLRHPLRPPYPFYIRPHPQRSSFLGPPIHLPVSKLHWITLGYDKSPVILQRSPETSPPQNPPSDRHHPSKTSNSFLKEIHSKEVPMQLLSKPPHYRTPLQNPPHSLSVTLPYHPQLCWKHLSQIGAVDQGHFFDSGL